MTEKISKAESFKLNIAQREEEQKFLREKRVEDKQNEIEQLKASLDQANSTIEKLKLFKKGDKEKPKPNNIKSSSPTNSIQTNQKGLLLLDLNQCEVLVKQCEDMINHQLDEYEGELSTLIQNQKIFSNANGDTEKGIVSNLSQEMTDLKDLFKIRITSLLDECKRVEKQMELIFEKYNACRDESKFTVNKVEETIVKQNALVLYTSQDGHMFNLYDCSRCTVCGLPSVTCSHNLERIITLPQNTTYLKLVNPNIVVKNSLELEDFENSSMNQRLKIFNMTQSRECDNVNVRLFKISPRKLLPRYGKIFTMCAGLKNQELYDSFHFQNVWHLYRTHMCIESTFSANTTTS